MNVILVPLLAVFGIAGGLFLGTGNYQGFLGAILPGLIGGAVLSIPFLRAHDWTSSGVLIACVLLGSLISARVPDTNSLKQYCRNQTSLHIQVFSYKLGRSVDQ
jgi:hypothetical protein